MQPTSVEPEMDWRSELDGWTGRSRSKREVYTPVCGESWRCWYDSVLNGKGTVRGGNDLFCLLRCEVVMSWSERNGRTTTQPGRRSEAKRARMVFSLFFGHLTDVIYL